MHDDWGLAAFPHTWRDASPNEFDHIIFVVADDEAMCSVG